MTFGVGSQRRVLGASPPASAAQARLRAELEQWSQAVPEEGDRREAAERVVAALASGASTLDLADLRLSSLPEALRELPRLNHLRCDMTTFEQLPLGIEQKVAPQDLAGFFESALQRGQHALAATGLAEPARGAYTSPVVGGAVSPGAGASTPRRPNTRLAAARRVAGPSWQAMAVQPSEQGPVHGAPNEQLGAATEELTKWAHHLMRAEAPTAQRLARSANAALGRLLQGTEARWGLPTQGCHRDAEYRLGVALSMALALREEVPVHAQALLASLKADAQFTELGGVLVPRGDIEALAQGQLPPPTERRGEERLALLNQVLHNVRAGWAPNVHFGGLLLQRQAASWF